MRNTYLMMLIVFAVAVTGACLIFWRPAEPITVGLKMALVVVGAMLSGALIRRLIVRTD